MTSITDIPDQRPPKIPVDISPALPLSPVSFAAAAKLLEEHGDRPWILIGAEEAVTKEMIAYMWDYWRGVSYFTVPISLLQNPHSWSLMGYVYAVIARP